MGYYQGDFYSGESGDPGIGSILRGIGRVARSAVGFIPGVGPIATRAITAITRRMPGPLARLPEAASGIARTTVTAIGRVVSKHPVLSAAGAAGAVGAMGGVLAGRMAAPRAAAVMGGMPGMRGFHISKKTGAVVRNRRMNVCNPRALRRSLRRAHGFARLAMRTIHLINPRKKGRFGGFKKRRHARV